MTAALRNLIDLAHQSAVVLAAHGHAQLARELSHAAMDCEPTVYLPRQREADAAATVLIQEHGWAANEKYCGKPVTAH